MSVYQISAEHVTRPGLDLIRAFCKEKKIRVTKSWFDETFTSYVHIRVSGTGATRVRNFIWNEINNGAYCHSRKVR